MEWERWEMVGPSGKPKVRATLGSNLNTKLVETINIFLSIRGNYGMR